MTVLLVYMFAGLPVHIGVLTQLGLSADDATKWFFITWLTTGLFSVTLSLLTKQPISINLSIPALVFLAGAGSGFSLPQILGANLVVGVVAIGLSVFRLTDAFARLVPTQVAIGVFVGSMFGFMLKTSSLAATDLAVAGPTVLGFVLTLAATRSHLLAVAIAAASGLLAVSVFGDVPAFANSGALPQVGLPSIEMDPAAMVALGIPLLVLTRCWKRPGAGDTAVRGVQNQRQPARACGGISTVVNALGGGHPAAIGGTTIAVSAGAGRGATCISLLGRRRLVHPRGGDRGGRGPCPAVRPGPARFIHAQRRSAGTCSPLHTHAAEDHGRASKNGGASSARCRRDPAFGPRDADGVLGASGRDRHRGG